MKYNFQKDKTIQGLIRWTKANEDVRAMLLTSSRAITAANLDAFSDYDGILVMKNIQPYFEKRAWLEDFRKVLVVYRDPCETYYGHPKCAFITR
jgi:hypothetical protein